jgi:hypothetical protein
MALIQSKQAKEEAPTNVVLMAGIETVNIYDVDLSAGMGASDVLEIGLLPANAIPVGITAIGVNTNTGQTADFGILSGEWRDNDDARTLATVLMNDVTIHNATAEGAVDALTDVAPSDKNRSIGMTHSNAIAAGAGKSVKVIVRTIMA